ncbi:DUF397 domain-containing protein [Streptomyces sp. Z26]|uniref:DUF397 domain-containing protein n=1 Tax=Streptomyces sp. Z26 TaxID=2500177 RepID=UPI000EF14915|nr:DUF397 domain-containing protein [Streptomyces sp. Z26]RLL68312.1 DUF397 domain-containing protein [Streptomyces sp. Z26]
MSAELAWFKSSYSNEEGGDCVEVAYSWHTSSYSNEEGGECVEVALPWHRSTYSNEEGGQCVEVAACDCAVHVRDSKNPDGPTFTATPAAWTAFVHRSVTAAAPADR